MKISTNTLNVLKNFAKINPSIVVQEGNVLKTISPSRTIMAKGTVDTTFDKKFAIYNLDRFISTVSLFNDPELKFGEKSVEIYDGIVSRSIRMLMKPLSLRLPIARSTSLLLMSASV